MPDMCSLPGLDVRPARDADVPQIVALWEACGLTRPHNHPQTDIAFARASPHADVLVVAGREGRIVASVMVGHDGHRGAVYYLAADPAGRGAGLGRLIMDAAERWLLEQGVWKINLMVRDSNLAVLDFYDALGYEKESVVTVSKRLMSMPHVDPDAPGVP